MGWDIFVGGIVMGIVTLSMQAWAIGHDGTHWQTMTFTVLCFGQWDMYWLPVSANPFFKIAYCQTNRCYGIVDNGLTSTAYYLYSVLSMRFFKPIRSRLGELALTIAVSSVAFWPWIKKFIVNRGK